MWIRRAFLGLYALLSLGCHGNDGVAPKELSLIWISLDTLRADHLQLYGYERDTSPFMLELARRGLYFEWAVTPQNSTLPTHATMFSGWHPVVHGVAHSRRNPGVRLAPSVRTLPEILADSGFETRAWTDGAKMGGAYGFARGFLSYRDQATPFPQTLDQALRALSAREPGRRFFYFIHTYEIHAPYAPPAPYDARYSEPNTSQAIESRDRYDGSIRFVDDELRRFVSVLESRGLLDSTILAITGDHGESFGEYGIPTIGHDGSNLHQNITRVPWILLHPEARYRGVVVEDLVGLIDFANTALPLLGVDERLPGGGIDVLARDAPGDRAYVSATTAAWSLYWGDHHLLWSPTGLASHNGIYDRIRDPLERAPLRDADLRAALVAKSRERIAVLHAQRDERQSGLREIRDMSQSERESLRALGYLVDDAPRTE